MTFKTRVTKNGNLKISDLARELLNLMPGDKVLVTIHDEIAGGENDEELLYIPHSDAMYQSLAELVREAGIDDSNGLISYVEDGAVVITGADEDDDYE